MRELGDKKLKKGNAWHPTYHRDQVEDASWCPVCGKDGELEKRKETGIGVKHCKACGRGWFILQTSGD